LQEELTALHRINTRLEEDLQGRLSHEGQLEVLIRQMREMEDKEQKREGYIKGVEKQLR